MRAPARPPPLPAPHRAASPERDAPEAAFGGPYRLGNGALRHLLETRRVPSVVQRALHAPGRPLDSDTRAALEARFGRDLGAVRLHTGADAAASARAVHARAFATGPDIVFGRGEFAPTTVEGRRLLTHEVAHTVEYASGHAPAGLIQRQESSEPVTARSVFPYESGERVTVNRLVSDGLLDVLAGIRPNLAGALRTLVGRRAEVTVATDDLFEARILPEPAAGETAAREAMLLRFSRTGEEFELQFFRLNDEGEEVWIDGLGGLRATRAGDVISLAGGGIGLAVRPGGETGRRRVDLTSPLSEGLLDVRALPQVEAGSTDERQAVERAVRDTGAARRTRLHRLRAEVGWLWHPGEAGAPLFGVSWQTSFIPVPTLSTLFQIPLEMQLQYAPDAAFLGRVTSGAETSLPLSLPVNVRFVLGVAGASIQADPEGADPSRRVLLGPDIGGAIGIEPGWFRVDVRYDYLWNFIDGSPDAHTFSLRAGGAF